MTPQSHRRKKGSEGLRATRHTAQECSVLCLRQEKLRTGQPGGHHPRSLRTARGQLPGHVRDRHTRARTSLTCPERCLQREGTPPPPRHAPYPRQAKDKQHPLLPGPPSGRAGLQHCGHPGPRSGGRGGWLDSQDKPSLPPAPTWWLGCRRERPPNRPGVCTSAAMLGSGAAPLRAVGSRGRRWFWGEQGTWWWVDQPPGWQ